MQRTIPVLFRQAVDAAAGDIWLCTEHEEHTYAEAMARVERAASGLRAAGVQASDRVLVTARNTGDYLLSWLALMEVGAVQVPVNPQSSEAELRGFVAQVTPALVITDGGLASIVDAAIDGTRSTRVDVGELFDASADGWGPADVDPSDVAVMIPTSGTTGRSKLVMQTHLAYVMAGEGFPYWLRLTSDDRLMTSLPLFHINAPAYTTLGSVAARSSMVLLPGFSASGFIGAARRFGATQFNSIGAMLEILMRQPERADDADNPLRLCYTGPSPTRERQEEIEARFGLEITCGYALSETPYGLVWRHGTRPYGTLGSARQHPELGHVNDARVLDDGGKPVAGGDIGELELRNPVIMRGYYEMPDETAAVMHEEEAEPAEPTGRRRPPGGFADRAAEEGERATPTGRRWLRTGDLVRDNGDETYTFIGRKKEVIRRRGENLAPAEVEAALEGHPDVAEAAVVGVPSELSEEEVKAFVVAGSGREVDVPGLHAFALERLAAYKVPRYIEVVDELPHTPTGRIAKHRLDTERTSAEVDFGDRRGQSR